jgi:hypothetical protein
MDIIQEKTSHRVDRAERLGCGATQSAPDSVSLL